MANDPYIQSFTCFDGTRRLLTARCRRLRWP